MTSARVGHVVGGRYRLDAELGSGGFGRVWRAHHETLGVDVAIKELRLRPGMSQAEQDDRLARATREARNAARLRRHENIVAIHDIFVEDGLPWIVMDLVDGSSLDEYVKAHGPLAPDRVADIARALLAAIGAAHAEGVVHRDVKPANVMLANDGTVLLTDFGIAVHANDPALTTTGMFIGSPEFTAPERLRGTDGLPASDLFSLGTTLYYAVEDVSPFRRGSEAASFSAVLLDEPPQPRQAGHLTALITRLMDKDPNQRVTVAEALAMVGGQSATAAVPANGRAGRGADTKVATEWKPSETRQAKAPGKIWQHKGIAALLVVLAAIGFSPATGSEIQGISWNLFFSSPLDVVAVVLVALAGLSGTGIARFVSPGAGATAKVAVGVLGCGLGSIGAIFAFDEVASTYIGIGKPDSDGEVATVSLVVVGLIVLLMTGWAWELWRGRRARSR
nr:serine/threonine-protein kinase [Kibdelosporangium sp. MJ126-NF4]CEL20066.1 serine/threonine protein kinase [Kibdelosporangium sp. MJ126-NF4]CTQ97290.1 serine/threonine protein kinase [Kibdelosporangium sp. MJ126-NF4]